jgi:glutamyl-tRNA synthetase
MSANAAVRVRFAPSPTGSLHLGGLRTALYNYLFARQQRGSFILRIEDTDQQRTVPGAADELIRMLQWSGIAPDEGVGAEPTGPHGPYVQSARLSLYHQHANELVASRAAYRCFCSPERLEALRVVAYKSGAPVAYDRRCMALDAAESNARARDGVSHVVRLAVPTGGVTLVRDRLHGEVSFRNADVGDQILLKADGFPTYHLANVVDDHLMRISHVIRGDEWLSSTPKHVLLYKAFGWTAPDFIHLPLLLNEDGTKFSKRHNHASVNFYRQNGFDALAVLNVVARLGWTPNTDDILTLDEMVREFSLDRLNVAAAVLNPKKLAWFNKRFLVRDDFRDTHLAELGTALVRAYPNAPDAADAAYVARVFDLLKSRMTDLHQFVERSAPMFQMPDYASDAAFAADAWNAQTSPALISALIARFEARDANASEHADEAAIERDIGAVGESAPKDAPFHKTLRFALTGTRVGAGLAPTIVVLGRQRTLQRLRHSLSKLAQQQG